MKHGQAIQSPGPRRIVKHYCEVNYAVPIPPQHFPDFSVFVFFGTIFSFFPVLFTKRAAIFAHLKNIMLFAFSPRILFIIYYYLFLHKITAKLPILSAFSHYFLVPANFRTIFTISQDFRNFTKFPFPPAAQSPDSTPNYPSFKLGRGGRTFLTVWTAIFFPRGVLDLCIGLIDAENVVSIIIHRWNPWIYVWTAVTVNAHVKISRIVMLISAPGMVILDPHLEGQSRGYFLTKGRLTKEFSACPSEGGFFFTWDRFLCLSPPPRIFTRSLSTAVVMDLRPELCVPFSPTHLTLVFFATSQCFIFWTEELFPFLRYHTDFDECWPQPRIFSAPRKIQPICMHGGRYWEGI